MKIVESPELKQYLENFVIQTLSKCELFTKVFGKNYAQERLRVNLDKVYVRPHYRKGAGWYECSDKFIVLCNNIIGRDSLSPEDIKNDESYKRTLLHESIHAILRKKSSELENGNLSSGTGIYEKYLNGAELGRGLNEGYTEWVCSKAGYPSDAYVTLRTFVDELEIAIGEERVMTLGKGNIIGNASIQLGMNPEECIAFLGLIDEVYKLQGRVKDLNYIISTIEEYKGRSKLSETERAKIEEKYNNLHEIPAYKRFIEIHNKVDLQQEEILKYQTYYFKVLLDKTKEKTTKNKSEVESQIFAKYFEAEFAELMQMESILVDKLEKFSTLYELISKEEILEDSVIGKFKADYEMLIERHFNYIYEQAEQAFKAGGLTGEKIEELSQRLLLDSKFKRSDSGLRYDRVKFFKKIATLLCPEEALAVSSLLSKLDVEGELNTISEYSIVKLKARGKGKNRGKTSEITAYQKGGKVESILSHYDEMLEEKEELYFTTELGEDIQKIMEEFEKLRDKELTKNPFAKIHIMDRLIVIDSNDEQSFYYILHGNIVEAHNITPNPIKLNFSQDELEQLNTQEDLHPVVVQKDFSQRLKSFIGGIFGKNADISNKLKSFIERIFKRNIESSHNEEERKNAVDLPKNFREELSNMSNYSTQGIGKVDGIRETNELSRGEKE